MVKEWRIPFEEFAAHIDQIIARVVDNRETIVIETEDDGVLTLQAGEPAEAAGHPEQTKSNEDYEAFLASAGSWSDLDADAFLEDIYASRDHASRPPVEL